MSIISAAGFVSEEVLHDYGEDLLVQTHHKDEMDASRLWFQVKGTQDTGRYRRSGGQLAMPFPVDHAIKWIRSADPVVVVLWDVEANHGYFAIPGLQLGDWDYRSGRDHKSVTLHFEPQDRLTSAVVRKMAWESRLARFRLLILDAQNRLDEWHQTTEEPWPSPVIRLIMWDLLNTLGVLEVDPNREHVRVTEECTEVFLTHCANAPKDGPVPESFMREATYLTVVDMTLRATEGDCGPEAVLQFAARGLWELLDIESHLTNKSVRE